MAFPVTPEGRILLETQMNTQVGGMGSLQRGQRGPNEATPTSGHTPLLFGTCVLECEVGGWPKARAQG